MYAWNLCMDVVGCMYSMLHKYIYRILWFWDRFSGDGKRWSLPTSSGYKNIPIRILWILYLPERSTFKWDDRCRRCITLEYDPGEGLSRAGQRRCRRGLRTQVLSNNPSVYNGEEMDQIVSILHFHTPWILPFSLLYDFKIGIYLYTRYVKLYIIHTNACLYIHRFRDAWFRRREPKDTYIYVYIYFIL